MALSADYITGVIDLGNNFVITNFSFIVSMDDNGLLI